MVQCVIESIRNINSILLLTIFFLFIFAVVGVQLFKGSFQHCTDETIMTEEDCVGSFNVTNENTGLPVSTVAMAILSTFVLFFHPDVRLFNLKLLEEREWVTYFFNYDNLAEAFQTLFTCSTGEGWPGILYASIDSSGVDENPREDNRPAMALFYILFMTLITFFMLNMFIGFVIVTFRDTIDEEFSDCPFDKSTRECFSFVFNAQIRKLIRPIHPKPYQIRALHIVEHPAFDVAIMTSIALNIVILMMTYEGMSEQYENTLFIFNVIFTLVFCIEAILKLAAFGVPGYFSDRWNIFDFLIVVGSIIDAGLDGQGVKIVFLRLFRAVRLVKLLKNSEIKQLLWTFLKSFGSLPWVALLILMLFYIYAIIGMQVFGRVQLNENEPINSNTNFRSLPQVGSFEKEPSYPNPSGFAGSSGYISRRP